ncbi:MAG: maleylpyruvate isomerase family mycothiol-dependent enzyme [Actinomycetota bacterium]|nr:maleylpyruvate isomerase family mycothiol-dependent enzyme [Actinomycetota bacterium]
MEEITTALAAQQDTLTDLLVGLEDSDWLRDSPCEGWSVADVVLHLAQTNELAIGSIAGRFAEAMAELTRGLEPASDVDDGAARMVARDRGSSRADIRERWQRSADGFTARLRSSDPHQRVAWVAGELSTRTLATTRLAETWIHTGDVARALDRVVQPTDGLRHIARLAWRTLPYAFARADRQLHGPVAFRLRAPDGQAWVFAPDSDPLTTIQGDAVDLCLVAARRAEPADTGLSAVGPDGAAVLELVRTYA